LKKCSQIILLKKEMVILMDNVYQEHGYKDRNEYLVSLSEEYSMPQQNILFLAEMLGENDDFDGLINALEDYEDGME
jgi:hypothetical protein